MMRGVIDRVSLGWNSIEMRAPYFSPLFTSSRTPRPGYTESMKPAISL